MVTQEIKNLLLFAIVILAVVIPSSFLVIGPDGVTAQAQSNLALFSEANQEGSERPPPAIGFEQQEAGASPAYQGVYMNPNALDSPGGLEPQEGQLEVVNNLESELSGRSTLSGYERSRASAFKSDGFPGLVGSDGVTDQAQNNLSLFSKSNQGGPGPWTPAMELVIDEQQEIGTGLTYQGVYTNPNALDSPGGFEPQEGQLEVVDDLEGEISVTSTFSGYEHIPASAFRSDGYPGAAVGYRFSVLGGTFPGGYVRSISAGDYVCMAAPVYVPHGATLTSFRMYFMDDHPTSDMYAEFWRKNHVSPGSSADLVADLYWLLGYGIDETTVFYAADSTMTPGTATVSNSYGYYVTFCFFPNTGLQHLVYGFRVDYDMPP